MPVGPLTNIALALRTAPDLHRRMAGISLMGGGTFGNREPVAEFNVWADPEAAAVVFDSGVPLVMACLDLTHQFVTTPELIARLQALPGRLAGVLGDLFAFFADNYISRHDEGLVGAAVHDPLAVLALTHPDLFVRRPRNVRVEARGELTRGMTVIDQRTITDSAARQLRHAGRGRRGRGMGGRARSDRLVQQIGRSPTVRSCAPR